MIKLQQQYKTVIALEILIAVGSAFGAVPQVSYTMSAGATPVAGTATTRLVVGSIGGAAPTALQWTLSYPAGDITGVSATVGASGTSSGKTLSCRNVSGGSTCAALGVNRNVIPAGAVADFVFTVSRTSYSSAIPVQFSTSSASTAAGTVISSVNGPTYYLFAVDPLGSTPALSNLTCASTSVQTPGSVVCTVSLTAAAAAGGFTVTLASGNSSVQVPPSLVIAQGASSATFVATAASVTSNQVAVLTAVAASVTKSFTLNLTAVPRYTISGNLGSAGSGARVLLSGAANSEVTADGAGNFSFPNLANGNYAVSPAKTGYTFTPVSRNVTLNGANVQGINFTAQRLTWTISGGLGTEGAGATVQLSGASTASTTADGSGNYGFPNLIDGTYTITPTVSGRTVTPLNRTITVAGANVAGVNFTVSGQTWSISGNVGAAGGSGTVSLKGTDVTKIATVDASGNYTFSGLSNGTYLIVPRMFSFFCQPYSRSVTVNGANVTSVNFRAQVNTSSISGALGPNGRGASVSLTFSTGVITTSADAVGSYAFTKLVSGDYVVSPAKNGYIFTPGSRQVTLERSSVSGINFTTQIAPADISNGFGPGSVSSTGTNVALNGLDDLSYAVAGPVGRAAYPLSASECAQLSGLAPAKVVEYRRDSRGASGETSQWISRPKAITTGASGKYIFRQTVDLATFLPETADIQLQVSTDDNVRVYVNCADSGISVGALQSEEAPVIVLPADNLIAGENQIDYVIERAVAKSEPVALRVQVVSATASPADSRVNYKLTSDVVGSTVAGAGETVAFDVQAVGAGGEDVFLELFDIDPAIAGAKIDFDPSPRLRVASGRLAGGSAKVRISIPPDTAPGVYSVVLRSDESHFAKLPVVVTNQSLEQLPLASTGGEACSALSSRIAHHQSLDLTGFDPSSAIVRFTLGGGAPARVYVNCKDTGILLEPSAEEFILPGDHLQEGPNSVDFVVDHWPSGSQNSVGVAIRDAKAARSTSISQTLSGPK